MYFLGVLDFDLSKNSEQAGQIRLEFKWEGLVNQVRDLLVPLDDYLETLPDEKRKLCAELFSEDIKSIAFERALARENEMPAQEDGAESCLPHNWRLRGVPDAFYFGEVEDVKPFDPNATLPSHVEDSTTFDPNAPLPAGVEMRRYYANHDTRETSIDPRGNVKDEGIRSWG